MAERYRELASRRHREPVYNRQPMDNPRQGLRLSLILPCYNEMEHIGVSLARIREFLAFSFPAGGYEIILVDDGSSDGTRDYLTALGQSACLRVVLNPSKLGRGGA